VSKLREQFTAPPAEPLSVEPTGDLRPYVIFTQLKAEGVWIYAGWLEAADDAMAVAFAREHYGQDQKCVNVLAIRREHVTSSDGLYPSPLPPGEGLGVRGKHERGADRRTPSPQPSPRGRGGQRGNQTQSFHVFTQKHAGDLWLSAGAVDAAKPQAAIETARQSLKQASNAHAVWVVASEHLISTHGDLIWRHTDQSYRLAKGYGREVRAKWIAFRSEAELAQYEKDDLQEAF
jgi:1,2-phenylacetyl-CoA epoxidase PaaB subunit